MKNIRKKKLFFQFFQVIESDPEDDLLEQATRPKYSRGPEMMSTPTYNMDTDISTLEAPTFSTLNKGPSQTMMSLRWDHQVNEMGRRVRFFYFHSYHTPFLQFYFFINPNISIRQNPFSYFQDSHENSHSELLQQQFHIKYHVMSKEILESFCFVPWVFYLALPLHKAK